MAAVVHIRKEALLIMIWAAAEMFKKECMGVIFGDTPSPSRDYFWVSDAIPFQGIKRRLNTEVVQSELSISRWNMFWDRLGSHPKRLGTFHSHPEWGSHRPPSEMSEEDTKDMRKQKSPLEIIVCISSRRKGSYLPWEPLEDGSIRGSLAIFNFQINAFTLVGEGDGIEPTRIRIVSTAALRKLNRVQQRKNQT